MLCLIDKEKLDIVSEIANGENFSNIAALLVHYVRTVRKNVGNPLTKTVKKDEGKSKVLTRCDLLKVKRQLHKSPYF